MASRVQEFQSSDEWRDHFNKHKESSQLIVVDFTATWCGPCEWIAPFFADLAEKYPDVVFVKIDIDELIDVTEEYDIQKLPSFVLFRQGVVIEKQMGANKWKLEKMVETNRSEPEADGSLPPEKMVETNITEQEPEPEPKAEPEAEADGSLPLEKMVETNRTKPEPELDGSLVETNITKPEGKMVETNRTKPEPELDGSLVETNITKPEGKMVETNRTKPEPELDGSLVETNITKPQGSLPLEKMVET